MAELSRLSAPLGVYAVLGNHDHWSGPAVLAELVAGLRSIGVRVLIDEAVVLENKKHSISLVGVDDYWEGPANLAKALRGLNPDDCTIVLSHNPDLNEDVDNQVQPVDLIVSGHTHGGQIVLPMIGPPYSTPFNRKYTAGLVRDGERQTWISRGLGVFLVPVRLGCPPDVSVLTLHSR
jgi:predicted MPP superfamily phosphohydrolase